MNRIFNRSLCSRSALACGAIALLLGCISSPASATLMSFTGTSFDGHAVSGSADFTLAAGTATIKLTNTTATTHDAGELFTGLDFTIGGLTPSLASKTGIQRTVAGNGTFTDTGSPQNLTWSLVSNGGGSFQLNFNPGASDAIIGPPISGVYSAANPSVAGNGPHNPFAAETATFVLTNNNFTPNTTVSATTFYFGTDLTKATGTITVGSGPPNTPEPSSLFLMALGVGLLVARRLR